MKVKDLIALLEKEDQNAEVHVYTDDLDGVHAPVGGIDHDFTRVIITA